MPFLSSLPCRLESTYRTHPPRRSRGEDIKVPGNERNIWAIINTLADWWFWGISPLLIGYSMPFHYEIWVLTLPKNMGLRYDITENDGWIGCYIGGEMHWGLWLLGTRPKSTNLIKELKEHLVWLKPCWTFLQFHINVYHLQCVWLRNDEWDVSRFGSCCQAADLWRCKGDISVVSWWPTEDLMTRRHKNKKYPCSVQKATLFTMIVGYIATIFP